MRTDSLGENWFTDCWNGIKKGASTAWRWVKKTSNTAWNCMKRTGSCTWGWIKNTGSTVAGFFKNTIWQKGIVDAIWNTFCKKWVWEKFCKEMVYNTFLKKWVWETFCKKWTWETFCKKWVWETFCKDWVWETFCKDWIADKAWNWLKTNWKKMHGLAYCFRRSNDYVDWPCSCNCWNYNSDCWSDYHGDRCSSVCNLGNWTDCQFLVWGCFMKIVLIIMYLLVLIFMPLYLITDNVIVGWIGYTSLFISSVISLINLIMSKSKG